MFVVELGLLVLLLEVPPLGVVRWRDLALVPLLVGRSLYPVVRLPMLAGTCRTPFLVHVPHTSFYVPGFVLRVSIAF